MPGLETQADVLADEIVRRLGGSVISSSLPAAAGRWIREAHSHGASLWVHTIPMSGPTAMFAEYRFNPDGTLNLEFRDTNGLAFWRGTFRPEADDAQS